MGTTYELDEDRGYIIKILDLKKYDKDIILNFIKVFEDFIQQWKKPLCYIYTTRKGLCAYYGDNFFTQDLDENFKENFPLKLKEVYFDDVGANDKKYYIWNGEIFNIEPYIICVNKYDNVVLEECWPPRTNNSNKSV
jgi:hypothetical protein